MKNFLKKYWLFITLAFVVSVLTGWYFINKFTIPKEIKESENLLSIPQQKINSYPLKVKPGFDYLISHFPEMVKNLETYEVETFIFSEEELSNLAERFGFGNEPKIIEDKTTKERIYAWGDSEKSLSINPVKANIDYIFINESPDSLIKNPFNINATKDYIRNFLIEKGLYPKDEKISLELKNSSYLKPIGNEYEKTNNPNESAVANFEFQYLINNYHLIETSINFLIGNNNEILKFYYRPSFKMIKSIGLYPLKTKEKIINDLKSFNSINYFEIISDYSFPEESRDIKTADFNEINLVYIKNATSQSYLQPFFFIKGQAILNDGRIAEIGIYLPAIKDEYLLK
ncbi:hypothetical protein MUP35_03085 [Patescibacteria group bacterium]|nr:hypothetical protein [Patescibacteria group bacterium]